MKQKHNKMLYRIPVLTIKQYTKEAAELVGDWRTRSQWSKGVKYYAHLLLLGLVEHSRAAEPLRPEDLKSLLLNGASDFATLAHGGGYIPFTRDEIESILCTKSERGRLSLSKLMACQTRALEQAYNMLRDDLKRISRQYKL